MEIKASDLQQGKHSENKEYRLYWNRSSGDYEIISKKDKKIVHQSKSLNNAVKTFNTLTGFFDTPVADESGMPNYYEVQTMRQSVGIT